jgi:hypothetical protein
MSQSLPIQLLKFIPRQVGIQICTMSDGYCITAHESTSDASAQRSILIYVSKEELAKFHAEIGEMLKG